jgi:hypothetical protein
MNLLYDGRSTTDGAEQTVAAQRNSFRYTSHEKLGTPQSQSGRDIPKTELQALSLIQLRYGLDHNSCSNLLTN